MHRSSESVAAIATALAKAQTELSNPEKSMVGMIHHNNRGDKPDILVVVRVDDWTSEIKGYIIVPLLVLPNEIWLSVTKARLERMRVYRSSTLEPLFSLCKRIGMGAPA